MFTKFMRQKKFVLRRQAQTGFTLIELLIVIAILAIISSVVFVALNPQARFQDARNSQRWADVTAILAAIKLYQVDHDGQFPTAIQNLTADYYYQIGTGDSCNDTCSNPTVVLQTSCVDLSDLVDNKYLPSIPIDPNASGASADETRYYLSKKTGGIITVGSCSEEQGSNSSTPNISVTR